MVVAVTEELTRTLCVITKHRNLTTADLDHGIKSYIPVFDAGFLFSVGDLC